jgi:ADP-ribose pyrophosphatase YjhB (NUDIX family)
MVTATIIVNVALIDREQVLLVQEGKDYCYGQWGLPGGRVEPGEKLADAAAREILEETGLEVTIDGLVRISRYTTQRGNHCVGFTFAAELAGGDLRVDGSEILRAAWMPLDRLEEIFALELRSPSVFRTILSDIQARRRLPTDLLYDAP